jgi:hypothetical protein
MLQRRIEIRRTMAFSPADHMAAGGWRKGACAAQRSCFKIKIRPLGDTPQMAGAQVVDADDADKRVGETRTEKNLRAERCHCVGPSSELRNKNEGGAK